MINYTSCLCGRVEQEVLLQQEADPSVLRLCHCDDCRSVTGLLFSSYLILQSSPETFDGLIKYEQSDDINRWFCGICGAHVFVQLKDKGLYLIASGLLKKPLCTELVQHWGIDDTRDGGLSPSLPGVEATDQVCWAKSGQTHPQAVPQREPRPLNHEKREHHSETDNKLLACCHCRGVQFYVTAPDASSFDASSPWPDLLVPYHSASSENPGDVKWWLRCQATKYLAGTCACNSCRLASGFPVQTWAFIPKSNIFTSDGSPLTFDMKTMQRYESSPRIYREFCNRCGATLFWHCEQRPRVIDVSAGLFRAKSGARANEWLEWATGRVSFAEEAPDRTLIQTLETGLRAWAGQVTSN